MNSIALHANYERCKTLIANIIFGDHDSKLMGDIYDLLELLHDLEQDAVEEKKTHSELKMKMKELDYLVNDLNAELEFINKRFNIRVNGKEYKDTKVQSSMDDWRKVDDK